MESKKLIASKIISILISLSILAFIYWFFNIEKILEVIYQVDLTWLISAILLVIPITFLTAYRLKIIAPSSSKISTIDSLKLILSASVINLFLPSKLGDLIKCSFIVKEKGVGYNEALPLVFFEKISDIISLLILVILGIFLAQLLDDIRILLLIFSVIILFILFLLLRSSSFAGSIFKVINKLTFNNFASKIDSFEVGWKKQTNLVLSKKFFFLRILILSICLWILHLTQIWILILSLGGNINFIDNLTISPIGILFGLLPLTFSGVGTRDFAFIFFYKGYLDLTISAALGVLYMIRYITPAIIGIPFLFGYIKKFKQ